jgi:hypothetical protein
LIAWNYTFATPANITTLNAPFGFIYVALGQTITQGSPSNLMGVNSFTSDTVAVSIGGSTNGTGTISAPYSGSVQWFTNAPLTNGMFTWASAAGGPGSVVPTTMGSVQDYFLNPPIVILT